MANKNEDYQKNYAKEIKEVTDSVGGYVNIFFKDGSSLLHTPDVHAVEKAEAAKEDGK
jgi:hypothetical protein